jgi:hypothetical protein
LDPGYQNLLFWIDKYRELLKKTYLPGSKGFMLDETGHPESQPAYNRRAISTFKYKPVI